MLPRFLSTKILEAATRYPVISLTGPRQSGKTTLARATFPGHAYVSLEAPDARDLALGDPRGFLARFRDGVILDEIQRAPDLFSYIQGLADNEDRPGRFILTGSQNFLVSDRISQSLAGRVAVLHLLPFSARELDGRPPLDPGALASAATSASTRPGPWELIFSGFYPRIHDKGLPPQDWLGNYVQTYLERDVRSIVNVGDLEVFGRFLRLCAGRNGQVLDQVSLGNDCGVSNTTVRRWLSVLEAGFIITLLRPHHANLGKRLIKSPKLYVLDTGLLCYLLGIRSSADLELHHLRGAVFESFVLAEILKAGLCAGQAPALHFWRDSHGNEVDFILEQGRLLQPVEVKSGQTLAANAFKGLESWLDLAGAAATDGILVYGGEDSFRHGRVTALSWSAL